MSYEIVKNIKIEDDKVLIKGAANNAIPRDYVYWECHPLTKTLKEKGQKALEIEILRAYEEGNFQSGTQNKYTRALKILRHMPEYEKFNWHTAQNLDNYTKYKATHEQEFSDLLKRALNSKLPEQSYVITKKVNEQDVYFHYRKGASFAKWYSTIDKATKFNFEEDAKNIKKWFTNSENWSIISA